MMTTHMILTMQVIPEQISGHLQNHHHDQHTSQVPQSIPRINPHHLQWRGGPNKKYATLDEQHTGEAL